MSADLHTHTLYSDGVLSPEQLLIKAQERGITILSITDHDTMDGYVVGEAIADKYGIELISGIELSCFEDGVDYHILGYFLDPDYPRLKTHLDIFRRERVKRAERIVKKLRNLSVNIHLDDVLERAGAGTIGRPHIAAEMVKNGYVKDLKNAFDRFLANGKPAFEGKPKFHVSEGVDLINASGGLAVLAHPGQMSYDRLHYIIECGIDGLEVVHPSHPLDIRVYYHNVAMHYWLLETGGSDFHGTRTYDESNFGEFVVQPSAVESMLNHLAKR